jgi:hypothetical protein
MSHFASNTTLKPIQERIQERIIMSPDIREDDLFIAANSFNLGIYNWLFVVSWGLIIAGYVRILFFR